ETWGVDWTPTLDKWPVVLDKIDHLGHSVLYAAAAGLAATLLAVVAGYLVDQQAVPARRIVDFICVLPAAVPGVFMGIGYLLTFNRPGIPLAGTAAIMVIAFAFANLPFGYQVVRAGLAQIDRHPPRRCGRRSRRLAPAHPVGRPSAAAVAGVRGRLDDDLRQLRHQSQHRHLPGHAGQPGRDLLDPRPDRRQSAGGRVGANHSPAGHYPAGGGADLADRAAHPFAGGDHRCLRPMSSWSGSASASARSRRYPR